MRKQSFAAPPWVPIKLTPEEEADHDRLWKRAIELGIVGDGAGKALRKLAREERTTVKDLKERMR